MGISGLIPYGIPMKLDFRSHVRAQALIFAWGSETGGKNTVCLTVTVQI
jgi:hypothetical protein